MLGMRQAVLTGSASACPECGGARVSPARHGRVGSPLYLTAPWQCASCEAVFHPQATMGQRAFAVGIGIALTSVAVCLAVNIVLIPVVSDFVVLRVGMGCLGALRGGQIVVVGLRGNP